MKHARNVTLPLKRGIPLASRPLVAEVGDPAPPFEAAPLVGRAPVRLLDYRGKVVCLEFWASWCKPCPQSLPWLERLHREYGASGFEVIGVNVDETPAEARRFLKRYPVGFPVINDASGALAAAYDVQDLPSSYFLDRAGVIRAAHHGFRRADAPRRRETLALLLREL